MNSIDISVGNHWEDDVRHIHSLRARRPADSSLDLLELRDIIDIVIDGTNLTASISEEAIFGLVGNILTALVELTEGERHKAIIEFHHKPWELVLVPDAASLQLSLYSVDRRRNVVARDLRIDARDFVDAICEVAEDMLTGLFRISEHFSSDQQVRQISQALATLKRTSPLQFPPRTIADDGGDIGVRVGSTSSSGGLTLGYHFDGDDVALRRYGGEDVFDLHALLVDGKLVAEFDDQTLVLSERYPFFAMADLLDRTRQLFNQLEGQPDASFCIDESLPYLDVTVEGQQRHWSLRLGDVDGNLERTWMATPAQCLDALVSVAELFVQDLVDTNPNLEVNQRYLDICREVEKLRDWHRDLCGDNQYHDRPEDYLRQQGHLEPQSTTAPQAPSVAWPLSDIHTLFPHRMWNFRATTIDFSTLTLTAYGLVVPTSEALLCLDPSSGESRWRFEFDDIGGPGGAVALAGDHLAVCHGAESLSVVDISNGAVGTRLDSRPAELRRLIGAARYAPRGLTVVAGHRGTIVGFEPGDATPRWTRETGPGTIHSAVFEGPLVCIQSTEGVLTTLNPESGQTLWKVRLGGTPELAVATHQGRLYSFTHDPLHGGSTIHALYPLTGHSIWQQRLDGVICGTPTFVGQWMLCPVEQRGQIQLAAIDLEAIAPKINWRLELSSAGIDEPTPVLATEINDRPHGLIRTDRAELTCFSVADGAVRWQSMPADQTLLLHGNLPLFRIGDAVINVSNTFDLRELATGRLLHSFSAIEAPEFSFLAAPFRLIVGERAPDDDEAHQLTAYSVEHFLALVDD